MKASAALTEREEVSQVAIPFRTDRQVMVVELKIHVAELIGLPLLKSG